MKLFDHSLVSAANQLLWTVLDHHEPLPSLTPCPTECPGAKWNPNLHVGGDVPGAHLHPGNACSRIHTNEPTCLCVPPLMQSYLRRQDFCSLVFCLLTHSHPDLSGSSLTSKYYSVLDDTVWIILKIYFIVISRDPVKYCNAIVLFLAVIWHGPGSDLFLLTFQWIPASRIVFPTLRPFQ